MELTSNWTPEQIPDLTGRVMIVTGANSGIGLETVKALLNKNAEIIFACKSLAKFETFFNGASPANKNKLHFISPLDLSDVNSIAAFANEFKKRFNRLDVLIQNAGIMNAPYQKTQQGVEIQFGVNHLGHFTLCAHLLDVLIKTSSARVVNVSSIAAHDAVFDLSTINCREDQYDKKTAYKFSKLANLYFSLELDRQFKKNDLGCISVAAHPGYAKSNLQRHSKGFLRRLHVLYTTTRYGQSAKMGALAVLRAATEKNLAGKEYFYPGSSNGLKGFPVPGKYPETALNTGNADALWKLSEAITHLKYKFSL